VLLSAQGTSGRILGQVFEVAGQGQIKGDMNDGHGVCQAIMGL
jgi:hypothetical protein